MNWFVCISVDLGRRRTRGNLRKGQQPTNTERGMYTSPTTLIYPNLIPRFIPAVYAQIIDQFRQEHKHALEDFGHEAQRRDAYVSEVLTYVAEEILEGKGLGSGSATASRWRSKVLTPIVQRQIAGVSDAYRPSLEHAVRDQTLDLSKNPQMTIAEATDFYLSMDPTDPQWITTYRRNLIYSRELRWYLAVLMKEQTGVEVGDAHYYKKTIEHHDYLLDESKILDSPTSSEGGEKEINDDLQDDEDPPLFTDMEVYVIISEGIEFFFEEELEGQVRRFELHNACEDDSSK